MMINRPKRNVMMFRYINMKLSQQVLYYAYNFTLALFLTFTLSPLEPGWHLMPPDDDGWFIGSIQASQNGPVCYCLRQIV